MVVLLVKSVQVNPDTHKPPQQLENKHPPPVNAVQEVPPLPPQKPHQAGNNPPLTLRLPGLTDLLNPADKGRRLAAGQQQLVHRPRHGDMPE